MFGLAPKWQVVRAETEAMMHRVRIKDLQKDLEDVRAEARRYINIIIEMKQHGFEGGPGVGEEPWPDGKYVMEDEETVQIQRVTYQPSEENTEVFVDADDDIEASILADLERVFPDED